MDYAIIESGGKQYVAREGQALEVDRLPVEAGQPLELERVLLVSDGGAVRIGTPLIEGVKVHATVTGHIRGDKIVVFRYIPKERFRRKAGHRQHYTRLMIDSIGEPGVRPARAEKAPPAPKKKAAPKPKAAPAGRKDEARKPEAPKAKPKPAAKKK